MTKKKNILKIHQKNIEEKEILHQNQEKEEKAKKGDEIVQNMIMRKAEKKAIPNPIRDKNRGRDLNLDIQRKRNKTVCVIKLNF